MNAKPAVHIHEANVNPSYLAEICAGLEEEGIPYAVTSATGEAKHLATNAANLSKLNVGIGITQELAVLQIRNCPIDTSTAQEAEAPILHVKLSNQNAKTRCRALGTNAARAVKGSTLV